MIVLVYPCKVSELRAGEGNNGNSSSLESSGTSDLVVVATPFLALTPFGSESLLNVTFAINHIVDLHGDTGLSIASGDGRVGGSVNYIFHLFEEIFLFLDIGDGIIIGLVASQVFFEVGTLRLINILEEEIFVSLLIFDGLLDVCLS